MFFKKFDKVFERKGVVMKKIVLTSCMAILFSCSSNKMERRPSSIQNTRFVTLLDNIENAAEEGTNSVSECSTKLDAFYRSLYEIDSKALEIEKFSVEQMNDFVRTSFLVRLEIKEKMKRLEVNNTESRKCLKSIKNIVRALRYVEDYFIEYAYSFDNKLNNEFKTLEGEGSHFVVNPNFDFNTHKDLKSGDVILSRGNAYSSAAIARIGDDDTQFSHLSLVYKDEKGKLHTSEAHIEVGNVVAPIDVHIEQKNARTVVFRTKDEKLAHRAGEYMYNKVNNFRKDNNKNIPYDFTMIYQDAEEIFCSEVVYHGYNEASRDLYGKDMDLPIHKTYFSKGLIKFLNKIGIPVNNKNIKKFDTFGPGEIQFDPRFEIVGEWRNPAKLKDSRFKDAILTKIFEWIEKDGYEFRPNVGHSVSHSAAWLLRRSKWSRSLIKYMTGSDLEEKFPLNMGVKQMNLFVVLDKVGDALYTELEKHQKESKRPLAFKELYNILDDFKNKDLEVYKKYKADRRYNLRKGNRGRGPRRRLVKPAFHKFFHS